MAHSDMTDEQFNIDKAVKYERGRREHRKNGEGFVGCPFLEAYSELVDLDNYFDEAEDVPERFRAYIREMAEWADDRVGL